MTENETRYDDEAVRRILGRALERRTDARGLTYEELVAVAAELGIDAQTLADATREERRAALAHHAQTSRLARRRAFAVAHATLFTLAAIVLASSARRVAIVLVALWGSAVVAQLFRAWRAPRGDA